MSELLSLSLGTSLGLLIFQHKTTAHLYRAEPWPRLMAALGLPGRAGSAGWGPVPPRRVLGGGGGLGDCAEPEFRVGGGLGLCLRPATRDGLLGVGCLPHLQARQELCPERDPSLLPTRTAPPHCPEVGTAGALRLRPRQASRKAECRVWEGELSPVSSWPSPGTVGSPGARPLQRLGSSHREASVRGGPGALDGAPGLSPRPAPHEVSPQKSGGAHSACFHIRG